MASGSQVDTLPPPPELHELEAQVVNAVWERGEASVRDVMGIVNPAAPRERAYTTYMTIMARLVRKGLLERRRKGKVDLYRPTYTRLEYSDRRARAELDSTVEQYGEVALVHIARQMAALDPQRRRALERMARER